MGIMEKNKKIKNKKILLNPSRLISILINSGLPIIIIIIIY